MQPKPFIFSSVSSWKQWSSLFWKTLIFYFPTLLSEIKLFSRDSTKYLLKFLQSELLSDSTSLSSSTSCVRCAVLEDARLSMPSANIFICVRGALPGPILRDSRNALFARGTIMSTNSWICQKMGKCGMKKGGLSLKDPWLRINTVAKE